ncbi:MAG: hypothetical protein JRL30_09955 [Deltaproteobacteria bacterium]|nr:hypothetical protein [Deltaproteobacteria bacterium]
MSFNIFSPIKKVKKRGKARDDLDKLIDSIERFAPKDHLSDREVYYYNYRIMDPYKRPLLALLETASQISRFQNDPQAHGRQLFMKLKSFYDVKGKLSVEEAIKDMSLVRRFRDFLIFFYDKKDLSGDDISAWLKNL